MVASHQKAPRNPETDWITEFEDSINLETEFMRRKELTPCSFCPFFSSRFSSPQQTKEMKLILSFLSAFSASSPGTLDQLPSLESPKVEPKNLCKLHESESSFINALSRVNGDQIFVSTGETTLDLDSDPKLKNLMKEISGKIEKARLDAIALADSLHGYDEVLKNYEISKQRQEKEIKTFFEDLISRRPEDQKDLEIIQKELLRNLKTCILVDLRKMVTKIGPIPELKESFEIVSEFVQKVSKVTDPEIVSTGLSFVNELLMIVGGLTVNYHTQQTIGRLRHGAYEPDDMTYSVKISPGLAPLSVPFQEEVDRLSPEDKVRIFGIRNPRRPRINL